MLPKREVKVLDIYVTSQNEFSSIHLGDFKFIIDHFYLCIHTLSWVDVH